MTQFKINKAYPALTRLADLKFPLNKAYALYKLIKDIEDCYQFAVSEEKKCIEEYDGKINPDGTITFENAEKLRAFQDRLSALHEMEVDIDFTPVQLTEDDMGEQSIASAEIYNLEGFVSFE